MKKLWAMCALLMWLGVANAQKIYFIYIQSDTKTPFFVKMGDQVTSATPSGYVIIPKLVDSVYQFTIGKTGQAAAESRFSITINKQDKGFLLREADGKFNLFDLQTMTSLQPLASASLSSETIAKRTDAFSLLLAQAANDPTLLDVRSPVTTAQSDTKKPPQPTPAVVLTTKEPEKEVAQAQQEAADTTATASVDTATSDSNIAAAPTDNDATEKPLSPDTAQQTVAQKEEPAPSTSSEETTPYKPSVVTRRSESSTSEGFGLVFLDEAEGAVDTIRILIPNPSFSVQKEESSTEDSKKFLNISNTDTVNKDTSVAAANDKLRAAETKKHKACTEAATEKDFFKLRKNMAAKESEDAMVEEAKKVFKKTCFSTEQIKNLSSLFLTSGGKYQFFDAAYGHVSNQEQYAALQSELNDAYYVNRFKALIANQ